MADFLSKLKSNMGSHAEDSSYSQSFTCYSEGAKEKKQNSRQCESHPSFRSSPNVTLNSLKNIWSSSCDMPSFSEGGSVKAQAKKLANMGRDGDTELVHVNKDEEKLLKTHGGRGSINPKTGLREYMFADSDLAAELPKSNLPNYEKRLLLEQNNKQDVQAARETFNQMASYYVAEIPEEKPKKLYIEDYPRNKYKQIGPTCQLTEAYNLNHYFKLKGLKASSTEKPGDKALFPNAYNTTALKQSDELRKKLLKLEDDKGDPKTIEEKEHLANLVSFQNDALLHPDFNKSGLKDAAPKTTKYLKAHGYDMKSFPETFALDYKNATISTIVKALEDKSPINMEVENYLGHVPGSRNTEKDSSYTGGPHDMVIVGIKDRSTPTNLAYKIYKNNCRKTLLTNVHLPRNIQEGVEEKLRKYEEFPVRDFPIKLYYEDPNYTDIKKGYCGPADDLDTAGRNVWVPEVDSKRPNHAQFKLPRTSQLSVYTAPAEEGSSAPKQVKGYSKEI